MAQPLKPGSHTDDAAGRAAPAFPAHIELPAIERPLRVPVAAMSEVGSAADLPARLFLGDLDYGSFCWEKRGWSALWRDADGPGLRLRYARGLSALEFVCAGIARVTLSSAERFDELAAALQDLPLAACMQQLAESLEARYNLKVLRPREDEAVAGGFPDGPALSLILPVPADRLMQLIELHKRLGQDSGLRTPVRARLRWVLSAVNYLEGRNPAMLAHPVGLVLYQVNALGTPAVQMPVREVDAAGVAAWTLQRQHYLYWAEVTLRDAARLIDRLAQAGFIGPASATGEGYPQGIEFAAALMPYGYERVARNIFWFDAARRRRVFYPAFIPAEDAPLRPHTGAEAWLRALARDAQRRSERLKADTLSAFGEGLYALTTR